ncbi:hypothetical protein COV93_01720 [Candidatus Woesearchaeota archaeon CG11_big_fil_rev_8_21_14_0_20_43_8]|nr:MAG: hypothetical protein COV93_01720 [Candidatus Woesearchaeota archaeon CG11_big_fil_rev_8_21_14_0_20_43_8]
MYNECRLPGDGSYLDSVLPYYVDLLRKDPDCRIAGHEADKIISRALHHSSEDVLRWIRGDQPVNDFVNTLMSLKEDIG